MRKFSLALAILLCLSMVLGLTSCKKSPEELIVGEWEAKIDMTDYFMEGFEGTLGEGAEYFDFGKIKMNFIMEFEEDGDFSFEIDEDDFADVIDDIKDALRDGMKGYLEASVAGMGVSLDELLAAQGTTLEDLIDQTVNSFEAEDMMDSFEKLKGEYEVKGDKLYVWDEDEDDGNYIEFEVDEDTLKLDAEDEDDVDEMFAEILPIKFKRVK